MTSTRLTDQEVVLYREHGIVILRGFKLPDEDLARLRSAYKRLLECNINTMTNRAWEPILKS